MNEIQKNLEEKPGIVIPSEARDLYPHKRRKPPYIFL
jgi:hypothetical protein